MTLTLRRILPPGATVGIGGCIAAGSPMGLVRSLVAGAVGDLNLVSSMTGGVAVDVALAADLGRSLRSAYVGLEGIAPVAPGFRRAIRAGAIEWFEYDEGTLVCALESAARRLPFGVWTAALGTSLAQLNPDIEQARDEVTGAPYLRVRPLSLDAALIWAPAADPDGTLGYSRTTYANELLINAAEVVVAQVDEIVPTEDLLLRFPVVLPHAATVLAQDAEGPHPTAGHRSPADRLWLSAYVHAVEESRWDEFARDRWALATAEHPDLLTVNA